MDPTRVRRQLALDRDNPEAWALMPSALDRVLAFAKRYQTDTTPESLRQSILTNFVAEAPMVRLAVIVEGGEVIGHLLISIEEWCGVRYGWVVQYKLDVAVRRALLAECMDDMMHWARTRGATALRAQATFLDDHGPARVRLFRSVWGFAPYRMVMQRVIGVVVEEEKA